MTQHNRSILSRRDLLQAGLWVSAAAAYARPLLAAPASAAPRSAAALPLITKPIPSTGEKLPAIGIGTDSFSGADPDALRSVLKRMGELGGTVIDTAAAYGDSETLIGQALKDLGTRSRMFIATKFTAGDFGIGGQASFERSLKRLQTDHVDLLQVHNLDGVDALMPLLHELKQARKIRYLGITTSRVRQHEETIAFMRKYPLDFVQVDYSIANRDAARTLLPLAMERRMAVLVNLPLGRAALIRQMATRALPPWAADIDVHSWAQFLLKYVISHPAVTCAIPGSTKLNHLEDNQGAARGRLPDAAMRRMMEQYWDA